MKIARITNDSKLLITNELIEETHKPTNNIELDGILRGWSGGYTANPETPNIYYVKGLRGGFMFPRTIFEVGETYALSFKIIKTSGDILTVGGHSQSFNDMEVYLDDELIGNNWGSRLINTYPNDNLEHNYRVNLTFTGTAGDSNLYIQPNRDNRYSTEYTAEVYELKLEKINKRPPNLSLDVLGNLTTKDKIIEYPIQLEGGRNLLPTDYESFVVDDGTYGWIKLADEGTPLTVKVYDTGADVDMGSTYFGLTKIGKNYSGGGSFWLMANGNLNRAESQSEEAMYFSFYPKNRVTFDRIFEKYKIKVETGGKNTPWTPAPEDLGLEYPSDIQRFNLGIKGNKLMVSELIEGGIDISTGKKNGMSSSSMYSLSYSPQNLVDGNITFGGGRAFASASNAPLPQWFQIDLGDIYYVDMVRWINNRTSARLPGDYRIEVSTTGAFNGEEILVASKENNTTYTWVEHRFSDTKGRYIRMTVTKIYAGSYFELAEWQIFGHPAVIGSH